MIFVYILLLEQNKYYVGRTNNINFRLNEHFNKFGSYFTKKYKPIKVKKIIQDCDYFDEDKYTIKMMAKYGIENVRGGSFTKINLSKCDINVINKMINNSKNKCFNCFSPSHFANECNEIKIKNSELILLQNDLIKNCIKYDLGNGIINLDNMLKVLIETNKKIFNNVSFSNIYEIAKKNNIIIDKTKNEINYLQFIKGLILLFDKEIILK